MSFHIPDEELLEMVRDGAKLKMAEGEQPQPEEADEPEPNPVAEAIEELTEAVQALADRSAQPAPAVHVAAPKINFTPPAEKPEPRQWKAEVTERDRDNRVKTIIFTAVD